MTWISMSLHERFPFLHWTGLLGTGDPFGIAVRENSYDRPASETLHLLSHLAGGLGMALRADALSSLATET